MALIKHKPPFSRVTVISDIEETRSEKRRRQYFILPTAPQTIFRNLWLSHLPHSLAGTGLFWAASSPGGVCGGDRLTAPSAKDRMANLKNIDDALRKRQWLTEPLLIFTDCTFDSRCRCRNGTHEPHTSSNRTALQFRYSPRGAGGVILRK